MIYFIQGKIGDPIKIGYTENHETLKKRIKVLQVSNPHDLSIVGIISRGKKHEASIHYMFRAYHIRGEWFRPSNEIFEFIKANCEFKNKCDDKLQKLLEEYDSYLSNRWNGETYSLSEEDYNWLDMKRQEIDNEMHNKGG